MEFTGYTGWKPRGKEVLRRQKCARFLMILLGYSTYTLRERVLWNLHIHFTDEETEPCRHVVTFPKSHGLLKSSPVFQSRDSVLGVEYRTL